MGKDRVGPGQTCIRCLCFVQLIVAKGEEMKRAAHVVPGVGGTVLRERIFGWSGLPKRYLPYNHYSILWLRYFHSRFTERSVEASRTTFPKITCLGDVDPDMTLKLNPSLFYLHCNINLFLQ